MARASYLLLMLFTLATTSVAFYSQSGAFPLDHPSFFGCSLLPLALALLALVGAFAPFDRPQSATLWCAPLVGIAVGVVASGALLFTVSFLYLGPPLVLYAFALWRSGRAVAGAAAPPPAATEEARGDDDDGDDEALQVSWLDLAPGTRAYARRRDETAGPHWLIGLGAVIGILATAAWLPPPGGVRPLPVDADVAPVISLPGVSLDTQRVLRAERWVEVNGADVQVRALVARPHVAAELGDFQIGVEPCLYVGQATVDGFFALPGLNTYQLEPGGPAITHYAEARRAGGGRYGWVKLTYKTGRLGISAPSRWVQPLARVDETALSATVELDVDLEQGSVLIDAQTRLARPLRLHRASFCWIKISGLESPHLSVGMAGSTRLPPPEGPRPQQAEFLVDDGDVGRVLRSRFGDQGPYEVLQQGALEGWWVVGDGDRRLLIVAPDWSAQASPETSRGAGHGVRENALVYWQEADALKLLFDLAGTRMGVGRLSVEYPAGVYRNRLWLRRLLPHEDARAIALAAVTRLGPLR